MKKYILLVFLLAYHTYTGTAQQKITPELITNGTFSQEYVEGLNWMNDGKFYSTITQGDKIMKYDVHTGKPVSIIFDSHEVHPQVVVDEYAFSADESKILLATALEPIYRRSFKAKYYIYDRERKTFESLSEKGKQSYATFSPDGSKVAFVRDNNLFMVYLNTMTETQITHDGKFNAIIHGSADWVYEEEFGFAQGFFWSPDSKKIAFYTFDESHVKEYNMQVWGDNGLYPHDYRFKYPKAGEENSKVNVSVYDVENQKIQPISIGEADDIYIPRLQWTNNPNILAIRKMNRLQNSLELIHADASTGTSKVILKEEEPNSYVDLEYIDDLFYLKDNLHFIAASEKTGFKHLFLYTIDGKQVQQITKGDWEVTQVVSIDENQKVPLLYYISTEVSPLERHFYQIDIRGNAKKRISEEKGTHNVSMSEDHQYYISSYSSTEIPTVTRLHQISEKGHELVKVIENNENVLLKTQQFHFAKKEFFDFITTDNVKLYGYMLKPQHFDAKKKYPVLMFVYGGPSSQKVTNEWTTDQISIWHQYLVQQGYIVACVDNRGTDARGAKFKKFTYKNLGKYEVKDQIEASQYLANQSFVDKKRIGIWGWSYGGYMSSLCMTVGADYFKLGIAVAPVTTWRLYDTIYTERFLQRPQDNPSGYDDNSPIQHASKLKGKFLMIHGTGDDNVHFQNAVLFQNALIKAGKQFDSFFYPDKNHGIYGGNTRQHLFMLMSTYVLNNL